MIDWNYDGVVMQPRITDVPGKNEIVEGVYDIPEDAGTIKVKITCNQVSDNAKIELYSNILDLKVDHSIRNDNTIILATAIVVLLIIAIITLILLSI
jgi:hypothetical protein